MTMMEYCRIGRDCYREIRKCDLNRASSTTSVSTDGYDTCRVLAESGDTSLAEFEYLEQAARGFTIFYLSQENTFPRIGTVGPGYHLLEVSEPTDDQAWARNLT